MAQKSFLERDSFRMGLIGTAVLIGLLFLALNFNSIPGINRQPHITPSSPTPVASRSVIPRRLRV